jgi:hypothetical protein
MSAASRSWPPGWLRQARSWILATLCLAGLSTLLFVATIPQDPAYHRFVDQRSLWGLPNFWNVVSNFPLLPVGLAGVLGVARRHWEGTRTPARAAYIAFFVGVALTGIGSAWYHLDPTNDTLVWDRLPMTIAFMGLFTAILTEHLHPRAQRALPWLLALGVGSVAYWSVSEHFGAGDLRPYALVQFLPAVLIPVVLVSYPGSYIRDSDLVVVLLFYALSKLAEHFDGALYTLTGTLSGHTLKHLLAALAAYWVLRMLRLRRNRDPSGPRNASTGGF